MTRFFLTSKFQKSILDSEAPIARPLNSDAAQTAPAAPAAPAAATPAAATAPAATTTPAPVTK